MSKFSFLEVDFELPESAPEGTLFVWHIPQIPMKPFHVPVDSPEEAIKILNVLAFYDMFQYENNIKPDYSNAQGLNVFEDGEWTEWCSPNGEEIDDYAEYLEFLDDYDHEANDPKFEEI